MSYESLPYYQYFIDTSKDWRKSGKSRFIPQYNHVKYEGKFLTFSAEWEMHYEADRNVIQINFEQTNGWKDWVVNFMFTDKMYGKFEYVDVKTNKIKKIQLRACKGWKNMWFAMKHQVRNNLNILLTEHNDADVEVVGWSLGSSLASFCAQDINYNFKIHPYLYTFGSVKPWRSLFVKRTREYLNQCSINKNFMHRNDIVTYMPPFAKFFASNPIKLGKFKFFGLFNPNKWHTEYGEEYLYE